MGGVWLSCGGVDSSREGNHLLQFRFLWCSVSECQNEIGGVVVDILVFEQGNLATGDVESLLLRLCKKCALINCKL